MDKALGLVSTMTPELIVSICLLIATAAGVLIAYIKLKPGLRVRIVRCVHKPVSPTSPEGKSKETGTLVEVQLKILNTGAKTSIETVGISCKPDGLPFQISEEVKTHHAIIVEQGEIEEYAHQFNIPNHQVYEMAFPCTFFLYHTYGKKKVKAKSNCQLA